jgi:hypothetical protein
MTDEIKPETPAGHGGYERQDLQTSSILYFLLTILVATAICMGILRGIFIYLDHREKANELYSYGWVDEKAGTVHIPIDRAMDLIVQRGLPVRPQAATSDSVNKKDEKK